MCEAPGYYCYYNMYIVFSSLRPWVRHDPEMNPTRDDTNYALILANKWYLRWKKTRYLPPNLYLHIQRVSLGMFIYFFNNTFILILIFGMFIVRVYLNTTDLDISIFLIVFKEYCVRLNFFFSNINYFFYSKYC